MSLPGLRVSAVRNRAARQARAPLLAFIDADHVLGKDWFTSVRRLLAEPQIAAVGAEYEAPRDGTWVQRTYDRLRQRRSVRPMSPGSRSGNLAIRADVFQQIGGFDESLETCEDVDLCRRLTLSAGRLVAADTLVSVHQGDPRTLGAVFAGEMWRGRDNLRVTFRPPLNVRSTLSALQPLVTMTVVAAAVLLMLADWRHALQYAVAAGAFVILASLPRTVQMAARGSDRSIGALAQCFAVAVAFDLGRAAAIILRATHTTRAAAVEGRS